VRTMRTFVTHTLVRSFLTLAVCISLPLIGSIARATDKTRGKSKAANTKKKSDKGREKNAKSARNSKESKKREDSRSARNAKSKKEDKRATAKRDKKKDTRATAKRDDRREKNSRNSKSRTKEVAKAVSTKDPRKMSRKEKRAEARRRAAEEAARRRAIEEARRRAIEEARRRELAFIQALRDDTIKNIQNDDTTGEDMEVRRAAIAALGDKSGTVVVMNPKTGQVYSVVNQEWGVRKGFKPCSTVKLVTSVAGLNEGEISPETEANYSTRRLNLIDALAFSNNPYFQSVGGRVGYEKMMDYSRELGLGAKTGINLPNESPGAIPDEKKGFALNRMSSHGDNYEVTPIQLAAMVSALGNGGYLLTPKVLRSEQEKARFTPQIRHRLNLSQKVIDDVLPGMAGAVNFGTAKGAQTPGYFIAGKTGSCTGQGSKLGLFASYGPVGDPQLAVVVITRGPGQKGKIAAGVAGQIYRALSHRFGPAPKVDMARIPTIPRQRNPIVTEENDDDATEETATKQSTNENGTVTNTNDSKVQTIIKTYPKNAPPQQKPATPAYQPKVIVPQSNPNNNNQQKTNDPTKQPLSSNKASDGQRLRIVPAKP